MKEYRFGVISMQFHGPYSTHCQTTETKKRT